MPITIRAAFSCWLLCVTLCAPAQAGRALITDWLVQRTPTDCGRALLAAIAGRSRGLEQAYRAIPDPKDSAAGYSIEEMQNHARGLGFELVLFGPAGVARAGDCANAGLAAHFAKFRRLIRSGRPIVVPVVIDRGARHYLMLVGAGADSFSVVDPASAAPGTVTSAELAQLMCDFSYIALEVRGARRP